MNYDYNEKIYVRAVSDSCWKSREFISLCKNTKGVWARSKTNSSIAYYYLYHKDIPLPKIECCVCRNSPVIETTNSKNGKFIYCDYCEAQTPTFITSLEAIKSWNRMVNIT